MKKHNKKLSISWYRVSVTAEMSTAKKFAKNLAVLMTGTTIAQAIPVLISPLLTRIYTPEDFGVFALYLAVASIIAVVVTGRYEMAIIIPKKHNTAWHIAVLSISLAGIACLCMLLLIVLFKSYFDRLLGWGDGAQWLYWLPASVFFMATYQSLNYLCNRDGHYKRMAISRILQSSAMSAVHIGGGYIRAGATGLISGQILGQLFATFALVYMMFVRESTKTLLISKYKMFALARRYADFPKYLILAHGFNTASAHSPIIFLSAYFGSGSAGFYILIQRVIGAPMAIIASAIADVFRHEASHEYARSGSCRMIFRKAFARLLFISIVPFVIFFFLAPTIFLVFFGESWREAGNYAQLLTPMFFLQFIASPLSAMYMIAQKQKLYLIWQFVLFGLIVVAFSVGAYADDIEVFLLLFSAFNSFMYAASGVVSYKLACGEWR